MSKVILPLHDNIIRRKWIDASLILQSREGKDMAHVAHKEEMPLHMACVRRAPAAFILDLIRINPDAAAKADKSGNYPLHLACQLRSSPDIIMGLIKAYPEALDQNNVQQCTPRYYRQTDPTSLSLLDRPTSCWIDSFGREPKRDAYHEKVARLRERKWEVTQMLEKQKDFNLLLRQKIEKLEPTTKTILNKGQLEKLQSKVEAFEKIKHAKMERIRNLVKLMELRAQSQETMTLAERRDESRYQTEYAERAADSLRTFEAEVEELTKNFDEVKKTISV
uniref:Uncharacterized protein n=2 Tax=Ditylum brightwellii TaxID=49249 RepID=A0A7S4SVR4_9STRA